MKASVQPYSRETLLERLEELYEVEFTWLKVDPLVEVLVNLDRDTQDFILGWAMRLLTTGMPYFSPTWSHTATRFRAVEVMRS